MDTRGIGLLLVTTGLGLAVIGMLVWSGALSFLGRLPGDVRFEGEHTKVFIPFASMLVISVALSLIAAVVRRFL